jgi:hypothetical protein
MVSSKDETLCCPQGENRQFCEGLKSLALLADSSGSGRRRSRETRGLSLRSQAGPIGFGSFLSKTTVF